MGNGQLKDEEQQEFVTFDIIQDSLGLNNPSLFKDYLKEVFNDIGNLNKKKIRYLNKNDFYDYIKLPILIAEKLFSSFSRTDPDNLTQDEFVENFYKLYMGTFEDTIKIIFNLLDFDKDGVIKKEDVKIILSYLPLNEDKYVEEKKDDKNKVELVSKIFGTQMKSLEEIDKIINDAFNDFNGVMNLEQFTKNITDNHSEIFLQILCFLYEQIPFTQSNIEEMKQKCNKENAEEEKEKEEITPQKSKRSGSIRIKAPNQCTLLSPVEKFLKKHNVRKMSLNSDTQSSSNVIKKFEKENASKDSDEDSEKSDKGELYLNIDETSNELAKKNYNKNADIVRLDNENILDTKIDTKIDTNLNKDKIKEVIEQSKKRYISPTKYLLEKNYNNNLSYVNSVSKSKNTKDTQLNSINEDEDETENNNNNPKEKDIIKTDTNNNIKYENWIYKLTQKGNLREFYLVLVNKDIYYYKNDKKADFVGMHNLSGCFVQETGSSTINDTKYRSFEIYSKSKNQTRRYYVENEQICKEFVENLKKAIGYVKFTDLYELKEVIGKGKFGVVNLGIHKKTGQNVAIKILNKENIKTDEDKELVRIEIGILKLCHHPNIVRLLDHLENNDYIYIVMEYIGGGTLGNYMKKKNFNFSEMQALNIMSQIANGVKYLQQYGIVHRDLKPDNIMITQQNNYGVIKIMDFGLSKIVSPNEKMVDGYGTLSYVAPEVLLRTPYNKEVDIWSMGVILFYMLSGKLPFRGKKEKEVAEKIVYEELEFDEDDWETRSQKVKDLIESCLQKKKEKRITIDEFINHPWFKKNMKQKLSM